ncbi:4'-phosphopantetheinyl transferase superfamily protein [Cellulomonas sp.]|uniref:4'-phosphopantetheinyl transferase family protein n=1 Tax=Cellulomonas sp. TaxID=40001 RepID=UPI001B0E2C7F|nr:4'-phosphopantetheinyl transferase superfamily protein [Cellulomonas sp.]MBO9553659.1 4'-phosphopantetheinyl transferase superfamily protein [Cellulomonas sp.]
MRPGPLVVPEREDLVVARLAAGTAHAVVLRVPGVDDERGPLPDVLDDAERARLVRFRLVPDRARYHAAHAALRLVFGALLDADPRALRFGRARVPGSEGGLGRPVLVGGLGIARAPAPADDGPAVEFSLSHGGGLVAIAVAGRGVPVGVDVEPVDPDALAVVPRLHPHERRHVEQTPHDDRPAAFTRLWTRKEAYVKAVGTGLRGALDADDLTVDPPGWTVVDRAVPGHTAALAAPTGSASSVTEA